MKRSLAYLFCLLLAGALLAGCASTTPAKPAEPEESVTEEAKSAESSANPALSGRPLNGDRLRDITSGYWYQKIQDFNTFQFKPDGTWYSLYSDEWAGTYTLSGNHLTIRSDEGWSYSLEYLPLSELVERASDKDDARDWANYISEKWNYSGNIFYELDYLDDGFDSAPFYFIPSTENPFT